MEKQSKVLVYEDTNATSECKDITLKAIELINEFLKVYNTWGFDPLSLEDIEDIAVGNVKLPDFVKDKVALHATDMKKMGIKHEAIMGMIELPEKHNEFEQKTAILQGFVKKNTYPGKPYVIAFSAIKLNDGLVTFNPEGLESYSDQFFRIYAKTDLQVRMCKLGAEIAKKLTDFQNELRDLGVLNRSGWGSTISIDSKYFKQSENGISLIFGSITHLK